LCNEALDEANPDKRDLFARNYGSPSGKSTSNVIREKAISHIRSAAERWARGDPESPPPHAVWDQLWRLLEDAGLVRPSEEKR